MRAWARRKMIGLRLCAWEIVDHLWNVAVCTARGHVWRTDWGEDGWVDTAHRFDGTSGGPVVTEQTRYCGRCTGRQRRRVVEA